MPRPATTKTARTNHAINWYWCAIIVSVGYKSLIAISTTEQLVEPPTLPPNPSDRSKPIVTITEIPTTLARRAVHAGLMFAATGLLAADAITKGEIAHLKALGEDVVHHIGSVASDAYTEIQKHL